MEIEKTIQELEKIKQIIIDRELTPDELSRAALKMSGYLIRLGEFIAQLIYDANDAYIYRKYKYSFEYSALSRDITVKDREHEVTIKTKEDHKNEIEKRRLADRVKTLHNDYRLFIMTIQSRLNILKSELFYQTNK